MDEIVYFFETTKTELVIIEDLDRFKSTNIFVALRELNNILNHYEKIEDKVKINNYLINELSGIIGNENIVVQG